MKSSHGEISKTPPQTTIIRPQWEYISEDPECRDARESLKLAFSSSILLFIDIERQKNGLGKEKAPHIHILDDRNIEER